MGMTLMFYPQEEEFRGRQSVERSTGSANRKDEGRRRTLWTTVDHAQARETSPKHDKLHGGLSLFERDIVALPHPHLDRPPPAATMSHLIGNKFNPPRRIPRAQPEALSIPRSWKRHKRGRVNQAQGGFYGSGDESASIRVWTVPSRIPLEGCFTRPTENTRTQGEGVWNE